MNAAKVVVSLDVYFQWLADLSGDGHWKFEDIPLWERCPHRSRCRWLIDADLEKSVN